jgi:hypothetical protein
MRGFIPQTADLTPAMERGTAHAPGISWTVIKNAAIYIYIHRHSIV